MSTLSLAIPENSSFVYIPLYKFITKFIDVYYSYYLRGAGVRNFIWYFCILPTADTERIMYGTPSNQYLCHVFKAMLYCR